MSPAPRDGPKSHLVTETAGPGKQQGRTAVHLDSPAHDRQRRARELQTSEIRYRRLFETAPYGILVLDADTAVVLEANAAVCKLLDITSEDILEQPLWSVAAFRNAAATRNQFRELLNRTYVRYDDLPLEATGGQIRRVEFICTPFRVEGKEFLQCMLHDITDRVRHAERQDAKLQESPQGTSQGTQDDMTGLVNRCFLEETLPRELHRAERARIPLTVALLDIDGFERVNEVHGRDAGDVLLREVGREIREHLRRSDTACRYGGDEFALVLPQSTGRATLERVEQVRVALRKLEVSHGNERMAGVVVSAGIVVAGVHGSNGPALLRAAQAALTAAKQAGGDRVVLQPTQEKK